VFDKAYEVRAVDLPVDLLLERLHEGKVYVPETAKLATENFFKEGNLIALRELALRRTAERVEAKMRGYKAAHGIEQTWQAGERVLVCISPSPHSSRLIRAARRMATSLHAELVALYVETPSSIRLSSEDRERLAQHMRLVESLDGQALTLRADDAPREIIRYARSRNVTKISCINSRLELCCTAIASRLIARMRIICCLSISGIFTLSSLLHSMSATFFSFVISFIPIDAAPGSVSPIASLADVIVDAVPIVMQCPGERAMPSSIARHDSSLRLPARFSAQYFQVSEPLPSG